VLCLDKPTAGLAQRESEVFAIRSTLVAVGDLDRSVAFYWDLGPFGEVAREDAVVVLGDVSPASIVLILRETRGIHWTRMASNRSVSARLSSMSDPSASGIGSSPYCEAVTSLRPVGRSPTGAPELLRGRDPDNLPLVFVCYAKDQALGPHYYRTVANLVLFTGRLSRPPGRESVPGKA